MKKTNIENFFQLYLMIAFNMNFKVAEMMKLIESYVIERGIKQGDGKF